MTWQTRWRVVCLTLPLVLMISILQGEMALFHAFLAGRNITEILPLVCCLPFLYAGIVLFAVEMQFRLEGWAKRKLRLEKRRVSLSPGKYGLIPWQQITQWQIEPVAEQPDLRKITIEYRLGRKSKNLRRWSLILKEPEELRSFRSELEHWKQAGENQAPLHELSAPTVESPQKQIPVAAICSVAMAYFLFIHGGPLLAVGIEGSFNPDKTSESKLNLSEKNNLRQILTPYFLSADQYVRFLLWTGGGLSTAAVVFYVNGFRIIKKFKAADNLSGTTLNT